jgi:hypothetical protein
MLAVRADRANGGGELAVAERCAAQQDLFNS